MHKKNIEIDFCLNLFRASLRTSLNLFCFSSFEKKKTSKSRRTDSNDRVFFSFFKKILLRIRQHYFLLNFKYQNILALY